MRRNRFSRYFWITRSPESPMLITDYDVKEQQFIKSIAGEPEDVGVRLIYADWLEERDQPGDLETATFIRNHQSGVALADMMDLTQSFITERVLGPFIDRVGVGADGNDAYADTTNKHVCTAYIKDGMVEVIHTTVGHWMMFCDPITDQHPIRKVVFDRTEDAEIGPDDHDRFKFDRYDDNMNRRIIYSLVMFTGPVRRASSSSMGSLVVPPQLPPVLLGHTPVDTNPFREVQVPTRKTRAEIGVDHRDVVIDGVENTGVRARRKLIQDVIGVRWPNIQFYGMSPHMSTQELIPADELTGV